MIHKDIGYLGEDIAAEYLQKHGYEIIERNFTVKGGEIDIIAKDGETLVFVEVKTRHGDGACGAEAVDEKKCAFLVSAAERFVFEKSGNASTMPARFDLVDVSLTQCGSIEVEHCKNIIF